jgi:hypothetical protein
VASRVASGLLNIVVIIEGSSQVVLASSVGGYHNREISSKNTHIFLTFSCKVKGFFRVLLRVVIEVLSG